MKVQNIKKSYANNRCRISAELVWETIDRPQEVIYFEVDKQFSSDISCNPDAFFLATLFPALYYGEQRYTIDEAISPALYQGVKDVLGLYRHWYYRDKHELITLEIETKGKKTQDTRNKNAAFFFSGGIDSYSTFVDNRQIYPKEHPGYIKDGVIVFGLEQDDPKKFGYVFSMLKEVVSRLEVTLLPVYTNIYLNYREEDASNNFYFWIWEFQGAALAAIAHILSNRFSTVSIASSLRVSNITPYGSHPLLEPNFSSNNLQIRHDGLIYSRLEKVKMVTDYLSVPFNLRVCNYFKKYKHNNLNCGRCEKCIRTMLEFLVLGKLNKMDSFPYDNVTAEMVLKGVKITSDDMIAPYTDLIPPLREIGRKDLANLLESKLNKYNSIKNKASGSNTFLKNKNFKRSYNKFKSIFV
ncbi:hypothetical protein [Fodinibius saliphilus]|uniref:hypothetical protein n=1 Tax=Fodinibius saliphilus TaxID=1920650 RepID=UPI001107D7D4|nr:hypothetical protein [Fodinibius saliphilus]